MADSHVTRREFIADTSKLALGAVIAPTIVPRHVLGGPGYQAPSDTLNVASVGIGGIGMSNLARLLNPAGERTENERPTAFLPEYAALASARERTSSPSATWTSRTWSGRSPDGFGPTAAVRYRPRQRNQQAAYTKAKKYADYREMLDKQKDIDAVVIATPDHMHAAIALMAMKAGKHVYVQKPLTYSVYEARLLARTARETKVTTQMGNQGHSKEGTRRIVELIASGVIGPVREVHVWTDRPQRYWAQGIPRPAQDVAQRAWQQQQAAERAAREAAARPAGQAAPAPSAPAAQQTPPGPPPPPRWNIRTVETAVLKAMADNPQSPPPGLNWDLFLGTAKEIPYHPVYHPFSWRGWVDFGVSAIGDMGAHLMDQPYWALGLTYPTSVVASSTPWGGWANDPASYPLAMTAHYEFPARGSQPPVMLHWYDGGLMPPRPPFIPDGTPLALGDGGGGVFIGEKGIITYETYGNNPTVYPESVAEAAARVPKSVARVDVAHETNWAQACKGQGQASSPSSTPRGSRK